MAQALTQMGQKSEGVLVAQNGWISFDLEPKDEREFLKDFGEHLTNLHEVRLDMLLWRGSTSTASRVLPLVSDGHAKLGKARIALQRNLGGLQTRISRIPKELKGDPGLAYDRFKWRLAHKLPKKAIQLLLSQSSDKGRLGQPNKWAAKRLVLARDLIGTKIPNSLYSSKKPSTDTGKRLC